MNKKILIPIIVLAVLIIITGGVFAYLYFGTDVLKSNKQAFFKYVSQNEKIVNALKSEGLEAYAEKQKTMPYTSEGSLKTDISSSDSQAQSLASALQNSSITFVGNVDKANNYSYQNISVNYSDSQAMKAEYLQKGNIYAVRLSDVWNRFLGIENNNLKAFATKMGVDESITQSIPDKLDLSSIAGTMQIFTQDEQKQLKEKYFAIISENMTDDMFSKESSQDGDSYTLTITQKQAENIAKKILASVKDDELILNKAREIMTNVANMTLEQANNYISEIQQQIEKIINTSSTEDTNSSNTSDDILDLETLNTTENEQGNLINSSETNNVNLKIRVYKKNNKLSKTEIGVEATNKNTTGLADESTNNQAAKLIIINSENGVRLEVQAGGNQNSYGINIEKTENENEIDYTFNFLQGENPLGTLAISYSGINTNVVTETSELEIDYESNKIVSTYKASKTFGATVDTNTINNNEIMLLNTAPSLEKIQTVVTQIGQKAVQVNNSKMTAAGFNESMYYIPYLGIIPFSASYVLQNPNNPALYASGFGILGGVSIAMMTGNNAIIQNVGQTIDNTTIQDSPQTQTQPTQTQPTQTQPQSQVQTQQQDQIKTSTQAQTQTSQEEDTLRLDLTEIYYNKTQTAGKNAKITKQDLESGIKNISVNVTENTDGTFSVVSNSTGIKYVVDSTGRIIKDETINNSVINTTLTNTTTNINEIQPIEGN